ncbi:MAG: hypothetical protein Q9168_003690, partial [Polycauliona sp. 1 TL-2023]
MAQPMPDDPNGATHLSTLGGPGGEAPRFEEPLKLKGRKRFLQSLQRMSSSPSLARMGRVPSSNYRIGGKASMSCVSLASSSSAYGHTYGNPSQSSVGFSTAPTSVVTTPAPENQAFDFRSRIRIIGHNVSNQTPKTPLTAPLPPEIRTGAKEVRLPDGLETTAPSGDYFSKPILDLVPQRKPRNIDFWGEMPDEIKVHIFRFLKPWEIVRCSAVSKAWHKMCFDGQLWTNIDTNEYYRDIPSASLVRIMTAAGPFVRDLNLRGCAQLWEKWNTHGQAISDACQNLECFSLEGCRIDRGSIHSFLLDNIRLVHINFCGVQAITNSELRTIAHRCPLLESLNVSWCTHMDTKGLLRIVQSCSKLKELKASETRGWAERKFILELYKRNTLERLVVSHSDLDDEALQLLLQGSDPEIDPLTDKTIVPPRRFRHLNFSRCNLLTDKGIKCLSHNVPHLAGLQVSHIINLSDDAFATLFDGTPLLTHLDMEEIDDITNSTLQTLAQSPCAPILQHLNISYCENLGDTGMLHIMRCCKSLRTVDMDNTRVSDLVLTEAAAQVRLRDHHRRQQQHIAMTEAAALDCHDNNIPLRIPPPKVSLHLTVYDCQNVTWTGIREILSRNTEPHRASIISLKCFYGYQDTVNEHMIR